MATYDYLKSKNGHKIQVESAKRDGAGKNIENNYAKQNGYYAQLTAGLADNFTPYSEDSGVHQENPFISNGTGTNNNQEIVTVGDYAFVEQKQGNSVVANQLFKSSGNDADKGVILTKIDDTHVNLNGTATAVAYLTVQSSLSLIKDHKYFIKCNNSNITGVAVLLERVSGGAFYDLTGKILTAANNYSTRFRFAISNGTQLDNVVLEILLVDITTWDADVIADITANPSHFFWYYNGSLAYNAGSLESANGVKLVSTGRNLFDGNLTLGGISSSTGEQSTSSSSSYFASTNFIRAISNKDFILSVISYPTGTIDRIYLHQYDKNKNYLGRQFAYATSRVFTLVSGTAFVKLEFLNNSVELTAIPNIQIVFSLYYTPEQGGEGYDKYYPYEEPTVVDTGSETLLNVGNSKDYKTKDGVIHRKTLHINFADLTFETYTVSDRQVFRATLTGYKKPISTSDTIDLLTDAPYTNRPSSDYAAYDNSIAFGLSTDYVYIRDDSCATVSALATKLQNKSFNVELAQETTEQGTPFAENLTINDYGMLYWLDENDNLVGIPQGAKIFFPVNYKGFVDDVYNRTSGDAGNLVLQEELQESETERDTVDTQLLNAIGGTLRQCLCIKASLDFNNTAFVDLGSLDWSYNGTRFLSLGISTTVKKPGDNDVANVLCTIYKTNSLNAYTDKQVAIDSGGPIAIKDSEYTDVDTFKTAMKGVLLAYEKA